MKASASRLLAIGLCLVVFSCAPGEGIHARIRLDTDRAWRGEFDRITDTVKAALRSARLPYRLGDRDGAIVIGSHDPNAIGPLRTAMQALRVSSEGVAPSALDVSETAAHELVVRVPEAYRAKWTAEYLRVIAGRIAQRIREDGDWSPAVAVVPPDQISVDVPGDTDMDRFRRTFDHAPEFEILLVDEDATAAYGRDGTIAIGVKIVPYADEHMNQMERPLALRRKPIIISGESLAAVWAESSPITRMPIVSIRLNPRGTAAFGEATRENVGGRFAVVLDDRVVTAPIIKVPILKGALYIEGNFTTKTANDLAFLLKAGTLSPGMRVIELRIQKRD